MDSEKKIGNSGLIIFCVGLGLLIFVFYLAYLCLFGKRWVWISKII